jgi:parvulin-like peptidyl-prolyl isomerase
MASTGGDIGVMPIGGMFWWIEDVLLNSKKGDVTLPVRTEDAFSILKVRNRKIITPERDKEYARRRLRAIKEDKMMYKVKREIAQNMDFEIFPDVLSIAYNSLPNDIPMEDIMERRVTYNTAPKFNLRDEFKGMILCQYEGNTYTLADFEYFYENLDLLARPRREQGREGIVNFMNKKFFNDVLPEYAEKKLKIMENPKVKEAYDKQVERVILSTLYNKAIKGKVQVTQADVDNYYKENKDKIVTNETREYTVVLNSDQEIIKKVKGLAEKGEDFGTLVSNFSEGPNNEKDNGIVKMHVENKDSELDRVAFDLPEKGAISESFKTDRGWVVLKIDSIVKKARVPEDKAERAIRQTLDQQKTDELFNSKVAEWRKNYSVEIYDKNLDKAKLTRTK